jgi:hypothetical protein
MHIHRFFQPHHNPRLINIAARQIELSELEQVATELCKALERIQQRTARRPVPPLMPAHFNDLIKAMNFVKHSLQTLVDAHPGDAPNTLMELYNERQELAGWETWTSVLKEQFTGSQNHGLNVNGPESLERSVQSRKD